MLLECKWCEATVDAKQVHNYEAYDEEMCCPIRYTFLSCPQCSGPFLTSQIDYGDGWDAPSMLYPPKDKCINSFFPEPIKQAYGEAVHCYKGKSFTAAAIMCRKTLEGICVAHDIKTNHLATSLKEMKNKGIIENRLFEWAEALRMTGNEAAHDVNVTVSAQDAKDILAFTDALLEYVFTFNDQFNEFIERRNKLSNSRNK